MNTDNLIEQIHAANALRRKEHGGRKTEDRARRSVWRITIPVVSAAAAVLLVLLLPRTNEAQAATPTPGIYCNSQCSPDDVMALIDNNINHIKEIKRT